MLSRLFHRSSRKTTSRTALDILEAGLDAEPTQRDLTRLIPIILPRSASDAGWPGPIVGMEGLPFCVAWATCGEMNSFFYVTDREAEFWETAGIDWRTIAMTNLARISVGRPASGEKLDEHGIPFLKVLLHEDAIGPSRLLLSHLFDEALGQDYQVAIPEQTCAIAFRKTLSVVEAADVSAMINGCYEHGTAPMSPNRFEAHQFWEISGVSAPQDG